MVADVMSGTEEDWAAWILLFGRLFAPETFEFKCGCSAYGQKILNQRLLDSISFLSSSL